jgi:hypothetical protein
MNVMLIKFKSIFKDSDFRKKNDKLDRDYTDEYEFYTMDYDNKKSKDMMCNHSVCYTTKDNVDLLKKLIKDLFPKATFQNSNPNNDFSKSYSIYKSTRYYMVWKK